MSSMHKPDGVVGGVSFFLYSVGNFVERTFSLMKTREWYILVNSEQYSTER